MPCYVGYHMLCYVGYHMLCYVGYHMLRHVGYHMLCYAGRVILRHIGRLPLVRRWASKGGQTMLSRSVSVANLRMDGPSYASAPFQGSNSTRRSVVPHTIGGVIPNTPLSIIPSTHGE